jgi:hypothetical protein
VGVGGRPGGGVSSDVGMWGGSPSSWRAREHFWYSPVSYAFLYKIGILTRQDTYVDMDMQGFFFFFFFPS